MLHSKLLRYLDEVARSGSIRAAAARLNVASSAVNKQVLMIEKEIGVPLFERLPRGLRLTPAGELMLAHIRQTINDYKNVEADIRDLQDTQSGELTLCTTNGLAGGIAPQVAAQFSERYPRIRIHVRVQFIRDIMSAVINGDADLGLAYNLPTDPSLRILEKMEARLGAVMSPGHPLAAMGSVPLSYCASYPLIFADKAMLLNSIMTDAFAGAGVEVRPTFSTNSIETMKFLAMAGRGIAFLSRFDIAEELRMGLLTYVHIRGNTVGSNSLTLVQRDKRSLGVAARLFAEDLFNALHSTVDDNGRNGGK
ncbi:MAG: LysR family transcriptional regulator [Telmatospirillum sp.]|nr:LysR family transcriptional regulator [Telmatospirillum sp.]